MDATSGIQKGILIGIVGRPGAHKFCDESALAGKRLAWNYDRLAPPPDHARMDEEPVRGVFRHKMPEVCLQRTQDIFQVVTSCYLLGTGIEKIKTTPLAAGRSVVADAQGIQSLHQTRGERFPTRREESDNPFHQLRLVRSNTDPQAISVKGDSCQPSQAVDLLHSRRSIFEPGQSRARGSGLDVTRKSRRFVHPSHNHLDRIIRSPSS